MVNEKRQVGHFELTQCNGGGVMDATIDKVFSSDIQRGEIPLLNDLRDLLQTDAAIPLLSPNSDSENDYDFEFKPKTDKIYIRKKTTTTKFSKVVTVRDVRKELEKSTLEYLPNELERKEKYVYRKICNGLVEKSTAKKMLRASDSLRKNTFHMITNLNPEKKLHKIQYVFWNGKKIRVNGSTGGDKKFIVNFDLGKLKAISKKSVVQSKENCKKNLIQKSLSIKFKPGPLAKKPKLDFSHQKYNVGPTELIRLPRVGLEVEPQVGKVLEPTISHILHSQREVNRCLTNNWAEFAVSTLSSFNNEEVQKSSDKFIFNLNYNNGQNVVIMRRDSDAVVSKYKNSTHFNLTTKESFPEVAKEVEEVLRDIVNAVEIGLNENDFYSKESETNKDVQNAHIEEKDTLLSHSKDKLKRKFGELAKLDVTVIQISNSTNENESQVCREVHCRLGCVCASLQTDLKLKNHCGRTECMFECTCDFSRFRNDGMIDVQYSDLLPGIINLDSKINSTLAKEEQKFHQTVVLTEDKSIVLKSQRRNTKAPKRYYTEFMDNEIEQPIPNTPKKITQRFLTIPLTKLPCRNIEPWCMVHNLYKCFCKGRFTESNVDSATNANNSDEIELRRRSSDEHEIKTKKYRKEQAATNENDLAYEVALQNSAENKECARVNTYSGRRFADSYYKETNGKIRIMEENDKKLQERLLKIVYKSLNEEKVCNLLDIPSSESSPKNTDAEHPVLTNPSYSNLKCDLSSGVQFQIPPIKRSQPNKAKLIAWLETNYKLYKNRLERSNKPVGLEPPKLGKIALYPWEVILDRFNQNKNYFLVTRETPYRIFMAVDLKNPFLENCMNIEDISLNDVEKYPITVKNLLQNISYLKDNFYILCGMAHCWELIGSVTKIREKSDSESDNQSVTESSTPEEPNVKKPEHKENISDRVSEKHVETLDYSKWFIMTVENDFTEIQFNNKGFFVKHENIMKAIIVARRSGKTVRLSSQKFAIDNNLPQFGLYAIPNSEKTCVFVGPYEKDENLGITTVKKQAGNKNIKNTRGFWITTKKMDDFKVIDNPMSFMPKHEPVREVSVSNVSTEVDIPHVNEVQNRIEKCTEESPISSMTMPLPTPTPSPSGCQPILSPTPLVSLKQVSSLSATASDSLETDTTNKTTNVIKLVKPIKLTKSNGIYQLAQDGTFKSISLLKKPLKTYSKDTIPFLAPKSSLPNTVTPVIKDTFSLSQYVDKNKKQQKPIAEIAPQIKASCSKSNSTEKRGMLILKPEEINEKHSRKLNCEPENKTDSNALDANENTDMDIEKFLSTNAICEPPSEDVLVISDDEEQDGGASAAPPSEATVWIESANDNINFGYIKGRKNHKNEISFEFPGFKFTDFYEEKEAFNKINQVLCRKMYIPKDIQLEWRVVNKEEDLKNPTLLKDEHLGRNLVLTRQKQNTEKVKTFEQLKTGLRELRETMGSCSEGVNLLTDTPIMLIDGATELIGDLERTCLKLEHEKESLHSDAALKKSQLLNMLLLAPEDLRKETTERMKAFLTS